MNNKMRQEIFALVEYCKIYNHDIEAFTFGEGVECPDLQSEKLDIGVECTSAVLQGEFEAIGKNSKINKIDKLCCFVYFVDNATDSCRLLDIVNTKTIKLNGHYKRFGTNALFIRVSSNFTGSKHFSSGKVGTFINILKNESFCDKVKFNPIILSELDINDYSFCFVINTDDYTVVEHHVKRSLSKNEFSDILGNGCL